MFNDYISTEDASLYTVGVNLKTYKIVYELSCPQVT